MTMQPNPCAAASHARCRVVVVGLLTCFGAVATLGAPVNAEAAVPTTLIIEGALATAAGGPVADGEYELAFALYATVDASAKSIMVGSSSSPAISVMSAAKPSKAPTGSSRLYA